MTRDIWPASILNLTCLVRAFVIEIRCTRWKHMRPCESCHIAQRFLLTARNTCLTKAAYKLGWANFVTFPNACHRAFCYCTSCHFTFPSQTYIQKSFFYRKCSDNDQIYVLWNFGFYKDYMPKPWKCLSLSLSFADFFQSIVVLSVDLLIRSSLLVTCRRGLLKEPLERSGFIRSLTSTTLPQCSNMLT